MKKLIILSAMICACAVNANAQRLLKTIGRRAVNSAETSVTMSADRAVYNGINSVLSGKVFKKSSKGAEESMTSYLNSEWGYKGQYPNSYSKEVEEGGATMTSKNGNIQVIYSGCAAEADVATLFENTVAEASNEFELLDSQKKSDGFTIVYNMGGTYVSLRTIIKDDRAATVAVTYPEVEAKSYKKLINNILDGLTFFK